MMRAKPFPEKCSRRFPQPELATESPASGTRTAIGPTQSLVFLPHPRTSAASNMLRDRADVVMQSCAVEGPAVCRQRHVRIEAFSPSPKTSVIPTAARSASDGKWRNLLFSPQIIFPLTHSTTWLNLPSLLNVLFPTKDVRAQMRIAPE